MNVFIVYAHHDPNSFTRALHDRAVDILSAQGHEIRISDLHAMKFKAVADDADFVTPRPDVGPGQGTDYQTRQGVASQDKSFSQDILDEHEKLAWADAVLFLYPYYIFNMPGILKGWYERIMVYGIHYGNDRATLGAYGSGGLRGKRALIGMSAGAPGYEANGAVSRARERIEAMQSGAFAYVGFDVMTPFVAWAAPAVTQEERLGYLAEWEDRVRNLFTEEPEMRADDGATPPPDLLLGRARSPGDRVWPYGGDKSIAGKVMLAKLRAPSGGADTLVAKLKPYVDAAVGDVDTRIYSVLRSPENADEIWLIEAFTDAESHSRHAAEEPFRNIAADVGGLLGAPPELTELRPEYSKGI